MENRLRKNEVFKTSHLVILVSLTNLSLVVTASTLANGWEAWALPLAFIGVVISWALHIRQSLTERARLWIYAILLLVTSFFFGIHGESIFDMTTIISALILVFTMTGEKHLITLSMLTYYLTMACATVGLWREGTLDRDAILRLVLHCILIILIGWTARVNIRKWAQLLLNVDSDIARLEEETHRMDDFLTNLSHEIRTPVNAVIGLTTVILKREKDDAVREDIKTVQSAGHRVAEKISDILDYTELDVGKLVVSREPYMIASVMNDLVTDLRMRGEISCELVFDVSPEIPSAILGDAGKVKKILNHLVTNGIKFTPKGGVYCRVYSMPRPYGVNLCIEVSDTGLGMTQTELEHIFDSFYQRNSGRTRGTGGLGLGLTIVHGLVREMGGFMTIDSTLGVGTTVSVSIPQEIVDADACMSLSDRDQLCLACFDCLEKLEVPQVRDFYNRMIANLTHGLGVPLHRAENEEELRKLQKLYRLTHIFVGAEEYLGAADYLESLTDETEVIVVANDAFVPRRSSAVKVLRKPFYCFPAATVLSLPTARQEELEDDRRIYTPGLETLVVDDEPMNLMVAEGIFSDYGMRVTTARSGPESIELCQRKHFDLIFMDHMMPEMDGVEAMKRLRSEAAQRGEEQIILALTANAVSSAREMFLAEGFDGFIPKPIEITDLERVLKRVLPKSAIRYERPSKMAAPDAAPDAAGEDAAKEDDPYAALEAVGISTRQGLRYCRGDSDFYRSMLLEFAQSAAGKMSGMRRFYDAADWKNYAILVHALKSTSKMIGAEKLSETARTLEFSAKENDVGTVSRLHESMLTSYVETSDAVLQCFGETPVSAPADAPGDGAADEVLEFMPEED
ncbi:MAG: response regulator [Ruminococcaceae bacterium]|nr:response regulator [Oscillospiraceae bacterium]